MFYKSTMAGLALLLTAVPASSAEILFLGKMHYDTASNCSQQKAGSVYQSVYRLSNLGPNNDRTLLSTVFDYGADTYTLRGSRFTSVFKIVEGAGATYSASQYSARVRIVSSLPADAAITPTTPSVSLKGAIESPQNDPGANGRKCVVTFRATYVRYDKP